MTGVYRHPFHPSWRIARRRRWVPSVAGGQVIHDRTVPPDRPLLDDAIERQLLSLASEGMLLDEAADPARIAQHLTTDRPFLDDTVDPARAAQHLATDAPLLDDTTDRARLAQHLAIDTPLLDDTTDRARLAQHLASDGLLLGEVTDRARLAQHLASDGLLLDHIVYRLREHVAAIGLLLVDSVDPVTTGITLRAEIDGVFMLSADLRDMQFTQRQGLFIPDTAASQGIRQHRIDDGLLLDDRAERLRELVFSIGLFLREVPVEVITSGVTQRLVLDGLFLLDQAVKLRELRHRDQLLIPDRRLSTLDRSLSDGTLFADQRERVREVLRIAADGLFVRDDRLSILEALLANRVLLDDSTIAQYFPFLIEAMTGVQMRVEQLLGARERVEKILTAKMGSRR